MGKLQDLMAKTKGLLDAFRPATEATDAVKHDRFQARIFDELMDEAPALKRLVDDLGRDIDYAEDLVRDTVLQFWQGSPDLRRPSEMKESHLPNLSVAKDIAHSQDLDDTRRFTQHDKYGAAMAAIGVSDRVKGWVDKHHDDVREKREAEERAREEAEQARKELEEAADQAATIDEDLPWLDPDFHGPLTDEQQAQVDAANAAAEALAQALAGATAAQQAQQAAADGMAQVAAQAQSQLQGPIDAAVAEARDKLADEAQTAAAWGIEPGELKKMDFDERANLAARLKGSRIGPYLDLVGRFKMMEAAQQVRKVEFGRDEVVGIEMTGDLNRVVMTEFTALAFDPAVDPELAELMELDFLRRWLEEQLIGRKFEGTEKVGKGAIVCCVDTSGSMSSKDGHGIPREAWAKAMAFALLDQARRQKRDFVGINFSSKHQVSVHRFESGRTDVHKAMVFVEEFFNGGTSFEAPLDAAMEIISKDFDERGKPKADIIFITDDDCHVSPDWMLKYQVEKKRIAFRTFGIAMGTTRPGGALDALSDNVRCVQEFADPSEVKDIFQLL